MILLMIVILWLVFISMGLSSLSLRRQHVNQVLGVALSKAHSQHLEVKKMISSFTKICYMVMFLSVMCSFLIFISIIKHYFEIFVLLLIILNFLANCYIFMIYQKRLIKIKEKNHWTYRRKNIVSVDLIVSREKGKSSISSVLIWLFFLVSFSPMVVCFLNHDILKLYPIWLSFIGPLCQLPTIFIYYKIKNQRFSIINEKTEVNLAYAQHKERIDSKSVTLYSLVILLYWIMSFSFMLYNENEFFTICLIFFVIAFLIISQWQINRTYKLEESFPCELPVDDENIQMKQGVWKWGCYYNPNDLRLFVPKRIGLSWTINFGRPAGKIFCSAFIVFILAIILFAVCMGSKDYQIRVQNSGIEIDVPMYNRAFKKKQVISVSVVNQLHDGIRINGYSSKNKRFGHFRFNKYGNCMLYIYNHVNQYIVIKLKGNDPSYVIINDKTIEKTKNTYQTITHWLSQ